MEGRGASRTGAVEGRADGPGAASDRVPRAERPRGPRPGGDRTPTSAWRVLLAVDVVAAAAVVAVLAWRGERVPANAQDHAAYASLAATSGGASALPGAAPAGAEGTVGPQGKDADPGAELVVERVVAVRRGDDVTVTLPLRVRRGGSFWAVAELWADPAGERPLAVAHERWDGLEPGEHRLPLIFAGAAAGGARTLVRRLVVLRADTTPPTPVAVLAERTFVAAAE